MNIRSTFALDKETVRALACLAERWQVSKSEALRRAVAQANSRASAEDELTPEKALEWLKHHPAPAAQVEEWLAENTAARRASDAQHDQRLEEAWGELASE